MPEYTAPPVVEVALGTAFQPIQRMGIIELVDLWREYFAELSEVEEQPRLQMPIERFDVVEAPTISFEVMSVAPMPRLWFHDKEGTRLVQLQNNWFARNWRKLETTERYPLYPAQRKAFKADLRHLADYVRTKGLGDIAPTQCEITYINHILGADVASVLNLIDDEGRGDMPSPEATNFAAQYVMKTGGEPVGRLHLQAVSGRSKASGEALVVLTLTARGRPIGEGFDGVFAFLDLGREWCDRAFDAVTRTEMQQQWGRRRGR